MSRKRYIADVWDVLDTHHVEGDDYLIVAEVDTQEDAEIICMKLNEFYEENEKLKSELQ